MRRKIVLTFLVLGGVILISVGIICVQFNNTNMNYIQNRETMNKEKLSENDYNSFYSDIQKQASYYDLYFVSKLYNFRVNDLSDHEKTRFILDIICNYKNSKVTEQLVVEEANNYFKDFKLYKDTIYSDNQLILFEYKDGNYIYSNSDLEKFSVVTDVVSNEGYTDYWILKKKNYFIQSIYKDNKYHNSIFKSANDCYSNDELYAFDTDTPASKVDDYSKIKNKLDTYIYLFKRDGNHYILDSIKVED